MPKPQISQKEKKQRSQLGAILQILVGIIGGTLLMTLSQESGLGAVMMMPIGLVFVAALHWILLFIGISRQHQLHYHIVPLIVIYSVLGFFALSANEAKYAEATKSAEEYRLNPQVGINYFSLSAVPLGYGEGLIPEQIPTPAPPPSDNQAMREAVWGTDGNYRPSFHFRSDGIRLLKAGLWNDEAKTIEVCEIDSNNSCKYRSWPVTRIPTPELDRLLKGKTADESYSDYQLFFLNGRAEVVRRIYSPPTRVTQVIVRNFTGKMISRVMLDDYVSISENMVLTSELGEQCNESRGASQTFYYPQKLPQHLQLSWREVASPNALHQLSITVPEISFWLRKKLQDRFGPYYWELSLYPNVAWLRLINRPARETQCKPIWEAETCNCNMISSQPNVELNTPQRSSNTQHTPNTATETQK